MRSQTHAGSKPGEAGAALQAARRAAMGAFARATLPELRLGLDQLDAATSCEMLRRPETGLVMLRGRIGGVGAPFNVGEATVTRAVMRLATGETGFSYVLGRDKEKARLAALADALWQQDTMRAAVEQRLVRPVKARLAAEEQRRAAQAAATKVEFFAMARGED
ncbi:MAG: phosphonate C-P lyase system protein PhnG [Methylobacteriaceae bacterium]|nr:phosphonate C-P lyase system protein PhnG [Methylobacteriaceae bacterium]